MLPEVLYTEKTHVRTQWWALIGALPVLFIWYAAIQQLIFKIPFGTKPTEDINLIISWIIIGILFPWFFLQAKLIVTVTTDELWVQWFPFHIHAKHWPRHEIIQAEVVAKGNRVVRVTFANGKKMLIGSTQAEALAAVLLSPAPLSQ